MSKWGNPTARPIKYELKVQRSTHKYSLEQGTLCFLHPFSGSSDLSPSLRQGSLFLEPVVFSSWVTTLFMTANVSGPSACSFCTHTDAPSLRPASVFQSARMKGLPQELMRLGMRPELPSPDEEDGGFPHRLHLRGPEAAPHTHSIHFPPFQGFRKILFLSPSHPPCSLPPPVYSWSLYIFSTSPLN